jgi:hypothetical protein
MCLPNIILVAPCSYSDKIIELICKTTSFETYQPLDIILRVVLFVVIMKQCLVGVLALSDNRHLFLFIYLLCGRMLPLVEKWTSIPVPEALCTGNQTGKKVLGQKPPPPPLVPVPYKPVLKGPPRWLPGECRARDLWYRFVTRTGTKGWLPCRGREFRV